jgi:hypothetical protein
LYNGSQPFDVHTYGTTAWVSSGGGITGSDAASSLSQLSLDQSTGQLVLLQQVWFGVAIKGFSIDSSGNMWVASQGDSLVYKVSQQGTILGKYNGGGVNGPWSATVDGEDNVWVANFGPLELADAYSPRITKLSNAGSALSPSEGWIVENAGDQVLLADGTPLYGEGAPPSYNALMRMTYIGIDLAGYVPRTGEAECSRMHTNRLARADLLVLCSLVRLDDVSNAYVESERERERETATEENGIELARQLL